MEMELNNGMVIAVPIPETYAPLGSQIESAIQQALQESKYAVKKLENIFCVSIVLMCRNTSGGLILIDYEKSQ